MKLQRNRWAEKSSFSCRSQKRSPDALQMKLKGGKLRKAAFVKGSATGGGREQASSLAADEAYVDSLYS